MLMDRGQSQGQGMTLEDLLRLLSQGVGGGNANVPGPPGQAVRMPQANPGYNPMSALDQYVSNNPATGSAGPTGTLTAPLPDSGVNNFLSQIMGTINGVGDMFDTGRGRPAPQTGDTLDALFQQLLGSVGQNGPSGDIQDILQQNAETIRSGYQPQIQQLRTANDRARNQAQRGQNQLGNMYDALASSYDRASNRAGARSRNSSRQIQGIADRSKNSLGKDVDQILSRDAALMRRLGQEDVAPEIISKISNQEARGDRQLTKLGAKHATYAREFGQNAKQFFNQGASAADFEGVNRQADITQQLGDILAANNNDIAGLKGERSREIANANSTLSAQAAQSQADYQSQVWDQLMQLAGLKMQMESGQQDSQLSQLDMLLKQQELQNGGGGSSPAENSLPDNLADSSNILSGLKPKFAVGGQQILNSLMQSPEMRYGQVKTENGDLTDITPEQVAYQAYQAAKAQGYPDPIAQKIWQAAYTAAQ